MKYADKLLLTEIDDEPENADAFFPLYNDWTEIEREAHDIDEKHQYRYAFVDYIRKQQTQR